MTSRIQVTAIIFVTALMSHDVIAGNIERPAGALPAAEVRDASLMSPRYQNAKSVLIPLRRKMSLALVDTTDVKAKSVTSASVTPASVTPASVTPASVTPATVTPAAVKKSAKSREPVKKPKDVAISEAPSIIDDSAPDVDPWDSAVTRFDQQDPSKSVSKGVRVEDIIEPTSDYQYSASRRKNPFLPDVVLGHDVKRKKELSPNDVEIPIISPLQSVPVASLAVIGVWEGDDHILKAMIETPTNQGIEAKLGDPAGNSGGRIMSITPDSVIVREFFLRPDGTREYSDKPIKMGGDTPPTATDSPGERWVLRPGSSTPELDKGQPTGSIITTPPASVPSGVPGTMSTLVPQMPAGSWAPNPNNPLIQSPVVPVQVQGGQ